MVKQELLDVYKETVSTVYSKIESRSCGVMYAVLKIILNENRDDLQFLVSKFGINPNSSLDEDKKFTHKLLDDVVKVVYVKRLKFGDLNASNFFAKISNDIDQYDPLKSSQSKEKNQMELIIIAACLMVGAFTCLKYLEREKNKKRLLPQLSLCLAVPSSAIYRFTEVTEGDHLDRDQIENLIESATEFKCVDESEEISVEIDPNEQISPDSQLKFYIRIDLENGGNIIGKETQYGMKRELPLNVKGTIRERGFLKDVSVLRNFNRV